MILNSCIIFSVKSKLDHSVMIVAKVLEQNFVKLKPDRIGIQTQDSTVFYCNFFGDLPNEMMVLI